MFRGGSRSEPECRFSVSGSSTLGVGEVAVAADGEGGQFFQDQLEADERLAGQVQRERLSVIGEDGVDRGALGLPGAAPTSLKT
jgi:hypothetical protein